MFSYDVPPIDLLNRFRKQQITTIETGIFKIYLNPVCQKIQENAKKESEK